MPQFEVTGPDGARYRVDAPEGATEAQVLERVKRQATTADPAGVADFFKSIPRGILGGLSETVSAGGRAAEIEMGQEESVPGKEETRSLLEKNVTGDLHKPETRAGRFGETVGEFLGNPASYIGPGGPAIKAATAATGGLGSEALGQILEGTSAEPYGRIIGGMLGATAPRAAVRTITPNPVSPQRLEAVNRLRAEGIEPTAGQITGSRALRYAESELGQAPGAGGARERAATRVDDGLTRAALARVGEVADRATPEVVDRAFTRIGGQFDALAARNQATYDAQFVQQLLDAQNNYNQLVSVSQRAPVVENMVNDALGRLSRSRTLEGDVYQSTRSRLERMRRNTKDPEVNMALAEMRDAYDNLMERSLTAANSPDLGAWQEVRRQYRNMLVIETAATGAGEKVAEGVITPAKLRQGAVAQDKRGYVRGRGDFSGLAHDANQILTPLPESGTGARVLMSAIPGVLGSAGAAGLGHGGYESVLAGILGTMAPGAAGRFLHSAPVQRWLANQRLAALLARLPSASRSAAQVSPAAAASANR